MKVIQLAKRNRKNRYSKNEEYTYGQAKNKVIEVSGKYFKTKIIGYFRRQVMEKVFEAFFKMTDLDKEGRHTVEK